MERGRGGDFTGVLLILAAGLLWGTTGTSQALAPQGTTPASLAAVRLAIAGLALAGFAFARGAIPSMRRLPLWPAFGAAAAVAAYQLLFFNGVLRAGVAVGTVVAIGSSPIFAGLLARLAGEERVGARWAGATALAVAGCALLVGLGEGPPTSVVGLALALGAGFAWAAYALLAKRLVARAAPEAGVAVAFAGGAALLSPFLFVADVSWAATPHGVAVALHVGLLATALSYSLFSRGLLRVPAATAVTLSLAEPLAASAFGILLLGERLAPPQWAGAALVLAGLLIASLPGRARGAPAPPP